MLLIALKEKSWWFHSLGLNAAMKSSVFQNVWTVNKAIPRAIETSPPKLLFSEDLSMGASLCPCACHCNGKRYKRAKKTSCIPVLSWQRKIFASSLSFCSISFFLEILNFELILAFKVLFQLVKSSKNYMAQSISQYLDHFQWLLPAHMTYINHGF